RRAWCWPDPLGTPQPRASTGRRWARRSAPPMATPTRRTPARGRAGSSRASKRRGESRRRSRRAGGEFSWSGVHLAGDGGGVGGTGGVPRSREDDAMVGRLRAGGVGARRVAGQGERLAATASEVDLAPVA